MKTSQISSMWYTQTANPWNTALPRTHRDSQVRVAVTGGKGQPGSVDRTEGDRACRQLRPENEATQTKTERRREKIEPPSP